MDYQVLFNLAVGLAAGFGGWTLNNISRALERLDSDVRSLPHNYVTRDDYREDLREIKGILRQIFEKLDGKADRDHRA